MEALSNIYYDLLVPGFYLITGNYLFYLLVVLAGFYYALGDNYLAVIIVIAIRTTQLMINYGDLDQDHRLPMKLICALLMVLLGVQIL